MGRAEKSARREVRAKENPPRVSDTSSEGVREDGARSEIRDAEPSTSARIFFERAQVMREVD